ncbi:BadF/BadG/BcrA/BcrD ATPase family protein [Amycolatopsis mongoliensis]|uniref:BadF/BadG/BcrA/BcrD ATPase family protein n=1 Tax=Amycolatopsis mongoliensis TaxID=715475 RepID=A0A9Y2JUQ7_9PSEU|nr:BadF/BadG/BcrA/BcrD ATPase family protein [Amycolatopsis sp. 4-36]WIY03319.1 BadF/BadG/BcrA/BcrD ATPase family protein [Amycolatopsis sp. 4-36]
MRPAVIAIDGGNSKTEVLVISEDGVVLGKSRGPGASPQNIGVAACVAALEELVLEALGPGAGEKPFAVHTSAYLAGLDFPREEEALHAALAARGWSDTLTVGNDTLALLRAGSAGVGVAVVCGAGINGAGVGPDGRVHRFPALGKISGDWGGGYRLGEEALWWAVRAEDGRGPRTALMPAVTAYFGKPTLLDVVQGLHFEEIDAASIHGLCPLLFEVAAAGDEVAGDIVTRFVEEVSVFAAVILRNLDLTEDAPEIVLGGGVLTGVGAPVIAEIERRCLKVAPRAVVRVVDVNPVVGAALFGLDTLGASDAAKASLKAATQRT